MPKGKLQWLEEGMFRDELKPEHVKENYGSGYEPPFIFGDNGPDRLHGTDGTDWIFAGSGKDVVYGGDGDDLIKGEESHDRLYGEGDNDRIDGGSGHDYIEGGAGEDVIQGGAGDDTLWGEGRENPDAQPYAREADIFVYVIDNWGADTIKDFDDGLDRIDFSRHQGISSMNDFTVTQSGADTVISYDFIANGPGGITTYTSTITLEGISASAIDQSDFIF